jgi:hypothetical protein
MASDQAAAFKCDGDFKLGGGEKLQPKIVLKYKLKLH